MSEFEEEWRDFLKGCETQTSYREFVPPIHPKVTFA